MIEPDERNHSELLHIVEIRYARSIEIPNTFFHAESERIAQACWAMARRFHQGGRLLAFGNGASATDAQHVAVEFVHPVIVGKRALPAIALTNDSATLGGLMAGGNAQMPFVRQIDVLARESDIAMGFALDRYSDNVQAALHRAHAMGLLTISLSGEGIDASSEPRPTCDFSFVVPARDPLVVQETQETLYHILWELVHVFFEHEGLLA